MNMPRLTEVELDKEPFACIRTGHWRKAGLADLPDDVVHLEWYVFVCACGGKEFGGRLNVINIIIIIIIIITIILIMTRVDVIKHLARSKVIAFLKRAEPML